MEPPAYHIANIPISITVIDPLLLMKRPGKETPIYEKWWSTSQGGSFFLYTCHIQASPAELTCSILFIFGYSTCSLWSTLLFLCQCPTIAITWPFLTCKTEEHTLIYARSNI